MKKTLLKPVLVFLSLVAFVSAHSGADDYSHHGMMGDFYGMMSGTGGYVGPIFMWLLGVLVLIVLVLLIIWAIKQNKEKPK